MNKGYIYYENEKNMNPQIDLFLNKAKKWNKEMDALRMIALGCGLMEEIKWGKPCYTFEGKNIVLIHGFKEYCALLFFSGALLKDNHKLLIQQTENVQAARQIRFTSIQEIISLEDTLKEYIQEAIKIEKVGLKVNFKTIDDFQIPEELQKYFDEDSALEKSFKSLTPGRQKGYILYFSAPKQSKTRSTRIEKYKQQILNGKGLNDNT